MRKRTESLCQGERRDNGSDWWDQVWGHREDLLRIARRRTASVEDAEDAVSEAMLRAAQRPELDPRRLGAWLTTVTVRLCVDRHRRSRREGLTDTASLDIPEPRAGAESWICDQAEAEWLAGHVHQLPARQAEAVRLRSAGLGIAQIAGRMDMSPSAIESLLARARRTLRAVLASAAAALAWVCGGFGRANHTTQVAVGATLGGLVIAALVLITPDEGNDGDQARPDMPVNVPAPGLSSTGPVTRPSTPGRSTASPAVEGGLSRAGVEKQTGRAGVPILLPVDIPDGYQLASAGDLFRRGDTVLATSVEFIPAAREDTSDVEPIVDATIERRDRPAMSGEDPCDVERSLHQLRICIRLLNEGSSRQIEFWRRVEFTHDLSRVPWLK